MVAPIPKRIFLKLSKFSNFALGIGWMGGPPSEIRQIELLLNVPQDHPLVVIDAGANLENWT